jgi:hypothetical protein
MISNNYSHSVVEEQPLLMMGLGNVLVKPQMHIAISSPHVETLEEILNLMNFLVKDSTGMMAFVVADVVVGVEADEVITKVDVLLQMVS